MLVVVISVGKRRVTGILIFFLDLSAQTFFFNEVYAFLLSYKNKSFRVRRLCHGQIPGVCGVRRPAGRAKASWGAQSRREHGLLDLLCARYAAKPLREVSPSPPNSPMTWVPITGGEIEAQRASGTSSRPHSWEVLELRFRPGAVTFTCPAMPGSCLLRL